MPLIANGLCLTWVQIIVAGDSAGGNMALGLVSHLLHPHRAIKPLELPRNSPLLNGVILVSPAVSFNTNSPTWKSNADKDIMTPYVFNKTIRAFVDLKDRDPYNEPGQADPEWWKGVPARHIKMLYGSYELFAADCKQLGTNLKASHTQIRITSRMLTYCRRIIRRPRWSRPSTRSTARA